jgi:salicylate hydroxylase
MHSRIDESSSGGGIGGLTCAIALAQYPDIQVNVYEAATKFAQVGAGIGIWPRPWKVLELLGLHHDLLKLTELKPMPGPGREIYFVRRLAANI